MQSDVVTVRPDASVREVARIMTRAKISGVPVVEDSGRIAGVVSAADLLRLAARQADLQLEELSFPGDWTDMATPESMPVEGDESDPWYAEPDGPRWLGVAGELDWADQAATGETQVRDVMTGAHFTVDADATVAELARFLLKGRIHRALVVEDDRLIAIVTSFDVLRAVADEG